VTRDPNRSDGEKPPLAAYFTLDALCFAGIWGYLTLLTKSQLVLKRLAIGVQRSRTQALRALTKYWYRNATRFLGGADRTFLDYGYVSLDQAEKQVELSDADEPDRMSIQLYHHVVGAIDVAGLDLLEVSCGHGGGALYMMTYLEPRSVVAVDLNPNAIEWCRRRIRVEGLSFSQCDAQSLPFEADRFDAVVNVEASHCYPDMKRFLSEVVRVLRPGGYFLFADARMGKKAGEQLHDELLNSGLELTRREDITANVVEALDLDSERRLEQVGRLAPRFMHRYLKEWAAVKGSNVYESFRTGEAVYLSYALRKPCG
jgi:ubiquinone/menaquinone biosynthesis C-methylase UbiE